ncbi:hypothetical protein [Catellatospora sichuanensis]|uniref:hypothetical protein n=1 Tax=Catellatospora sichuanensis TaxID=1969805 RepID=UPI001181CA58|nr:hypothetical protein [Catellatospora sichuanensis]
MQPTLQRMIETSITGSPADLDFKTVARSVRARDRQELWSRIQINCLHSAVNVSDHLRALALMLSAPTVGVPVYAHTTVARVAVESAANVAHVLDPAEAFELRFARGIAFLIDDSRSAQQAAKRVPGNAYMQAPGPRFQRRHDDLLGVIARARIEITVNRNGNPKGVRTSPGGPEAPIDLKMSDLITRLYLHLPGLYNLMSGVTHGLPHTLSGNARFADRRAEWNMDPLDVASSVLAALNAADSVLAHIGWHRGASDDPEVAETRTRIAAVDTAMVHFGRAHVPLPKPAALRAARSTG